MIIDNYNLLEKQLSTNITKEIAPIKALLSGGVEDEDELFDILEKSMNHYFEYINSLDEVNDINVNINRNAKITFASGDGNNRLAVLSSLIQLMADIHKLSHTHMIRILNREMFSWAMNLDNNPNHNSVDSIFDFSGYNDTLDSKDIFDEYYHALNDLIRQTIAADIDETADIETVLRKRIEAILDNTSIILTDSAFKPYQASNIVVRNMILTAAKNYISPTGVISVTVGELHDRESKLIQNRVLNKVEPLTFWDTINRVINLLRETLIISKCIRCEFNIQHALLIAITRYFNKHTTF